MGWAWAGIVGWAKAASDVALWHHAKSAVPTRLAWPAWARRNARCANPPTSLAAFAHPTRDSASMYARPRGAGARHHLAGLRAGGERLQGAGGIDQAGPVLLALRLGRERGRGLHQDRPHLVRRDARLALDQQRR